MVDLADDRFDVSFDPDRVSTAQLLRTIGDLDYEPEIVDVPTEITVIADGVDVTALPDSFGDLFGKAEALRKPVLVEFSGPG